jgi:hypothetical protein
MMMAHENGKLDKVAGSSNVFTAKAA